jgi:gamma-butyrobetaine dioxygenase
VTGSALGFPTVWLRHNCRCPECLDPITGQRLIEVTAIPNECRVTLEAQTAESVTVVFAPEGHRSVFSQAWLAAHALPAGVSAPALADWASYLGDDAVRAACLDAVASLGFALLRGVPARSGTVLRVAGTFGFVRETNYGKLFDVRVVGDPANLAFTSRAIAPHTDNPYRDPVPTLQLLHCLRDASRGGDTGLVDGFAAAAALRRADPASFAVLRPHRVRRGRDGG